MAFVEDMSVFFPKDGVGVVSIAFGGTQVNGYIDAPQAAGSPFGLSVADTEYTLTFPANAFRPMPETADSLKANGVAYKVKSVTPVDDGAVVEVKVKKA